VSATLTSMARLGVVRRHRTRIRRRSIIAIGAAARADAHVHDRRTKSIVLRGLFLCLHLNDVELLRAV